MSQVGIVVLGVVGSICALLLVLAGTVWAPSINWPLVSIGLVFLGGNVVFAFLNYRRQRARDRQAQ